MTKKIAVITINYNDKKGLEKTITSISNQTYKDYEFVVIDGNSNDGSKEIIEANSSAIDYWISEPDKGVYNAMNKGIKAAKADFVIFMNSGDVFCNENVLSLIEKHLTSDFDIYYGNNYKVKENGSKRLKTYPEKLSFSFFYRSCINHQSTFIRRKLFYDHFFYNEDYKVASDWEFFIYTICHENVPYKHLPITISNYDYTGISSTDRLRNSTAIEKKKTIDKYFPLFSKDYVQIAELNTRRIQQVLHIQKFPIAWKMLKMFISVIYLFIPKIKK